jgi:sugar phosphate isomerase/epimerase
MTLFVNTLMYQAAVEAGTKQADLVATVAATGAKGIEVRREYFTDLATELPAVAAAAKEAGVAVAYSIPANLFLEGGTPNPDLATFAAETKVLGAVKAKFNTGYFADFTGDLAAALAPILSPDYQVNVENDQTAVSGPADHILAFLNAAKDAGLSVGYTYDLGNWAYTGGDAVANARALAPFTRYIHYKNVVENPDGSFATTTDLAAGIYDYEEIAQLLPATDVALEYPVADADAVAEQVARYHAGLGA